MPPIQILAPLSGQVWPLERVPDPVFAQKMVGDGLSIDPTDAVLVAACNGEVMSLHAAGHAVTLRTPEGVELLMHVGIDTVALKGEGFKPRVKVGDQVKAGAPLIEFDLDFLATHAKSLLTQIVVANSERVKSWERASGHVVAGKDTLFTVTLDGEAAAAPASGAATVTSEAILIPNPTGLHARPAAVLANLAKGFQSSIKLQLGDRQANARSVTSIMALDVAHGAKVQVVASGPDAKAAAAEVNRSQSAGWRLGLAGPGGRRSVSDSWPPCGDSFMPNASPRRRPSLPRTRNCLRIPISWRSPSRESPRAKARRSRGRRPSPRTPIS